MRKSGLSGYCFLESVISNLRRLIIFFFVVCALVSFMGFSAKGQERAEVCAKERFYREQEQKLLQETREALSQMGFVGSGVTLNRVVERDVERTYTFSIHHSRIDSMEPAERQNLAEALAVLTEQFPRAASEDVCVFQYSFLVLT